MFICKYDNIYDTKEVMFNENGDLSPLNIERDYENFIAYYVYQDYSPEHMEKLSKDEIQNNIKTKIDRLEYIDVKRFKYIDNEITLEEYEPYRLEAIQLRLEIKQLESELL